MPPESLPARRSRNGPRFEKAKSRSRRAGALGARHAVEVGVEVEVLVHGEVGVEPEALRHVGEPGLHAPPGRATTEIAVEMRVAGARPQHAGEHAQGGRLAGAVGADEPEELAGRDLEVEAGDGHRASSARLPKRRARPRTSTAGASPLARWRRWLRWLAPRRRPRCGRHSPPPA